jgi:hypothetical protein
MAGAFAATFFAPESIRIGGCVPSIQSFTFGDSAQQKTPETVHFGIELGVLSNLPFRGSITHILVGAT